MTDLSHCSILLVDDTEASLDILVQTLGDDYEIRVAMDGESALERVAEQPPDLILLDIMMPGMDGYEVCRRLQENDRTSRIPVVFLTAMNQDEDAAKGLALGAIDYIGKPFNPELVKARIRNHLLLKHYRDGREPLVEKGTGISPTEKVRVRPENTDNNHPWRTAMERNETAKPRILVVDDTEASIDILVDTLGDLHDISVAMDGPTALRIIAENPPDLILLDIMMPDMDGYEVCRQLKADAKTAEIPVIFVTVMGEIHDETKGFAAGAVDYIAKPFSPPIVRARIRTHLLIKQQHDQLKKSISLMEHKAEILQQKADLGIQAFSLAHDLNNILSSVGYIELIDELLPPAFPDRDVVEKYLKSIGQCFQTGIEICRGYTYYLKDIDEGMKIQPLEPLLQPLDIFAHKYKGTLIRNFDANVPPINCKGYQLKRVFMNLFINACQAVEHMDEQTIEVRLWSDRDRVFFSIRDNGPGIAADILPRIYEERFTTKATGSGLGLFLVKQIVDNHAGNIEVLSEEGRGTTFTVSFPACSIPS